MANDCSVKNSQDKDKCKAYYANYRACMEFWVIFQCHLKQNNTLINVINLYIQKKIKAERRAQRIQPLLPPPEEREQILREQQKKTS